MQVTDGEQPLRPTLSFDTDANLREQHMTHDCDSWDAMLAESVAATKVTHQENTLGYRLHANVVSLTLDHKDSI